MQIRKAHYGIFCKIVIFVPVYSTYHFRHAVQGHSDISQRSCEDIASGGGTGGRYLRSRVTVAVSVLFAAVALTGYVLLAVSGAGSGIGLWHYRIGIVAAALFCGHILKRAQALRKSLSGSGRQASGKVRRACRRVRRTMSVH